MGRVRGRFHLTALFYLPIVVLIGWAVDRLTFENVCISFSTAVIVGALIEIFRDIKTLWQKR